ncbi:MAG: hypothetical protein Q7J68_04190 [Thermoplasmata archaeon]|nr:hypothetical protein [Thermoplasmata archaeon]
MMAITGGGYAALKIVLQQAAKEVMTKGFITATIMASAATIGIGAIETFSDGFFSNTLGIIFKSFVGGTLIVSACMDVYSNLQKEKISPQEKRSYVAALVLTGLFIEVFGGDLLSSALTGLGVESPFAKGILAMTLDVGGLILVAFGLQKFFKSNPTEKAWNVFEEIWSGITTSAEDTITILGFIGAVVGATFNAASGNWQWWEVSP